MRRHLFYGLLLGLLAIGGLQAGCATGGNLPWDVDHSNNPPQGIPGMDPVHGGGNGLR